MTFLQSTTEITEEPANLVVGILGYQQMPTWDSGALVGHLTKIGEGNVLVDLLAGNLVENPTHEVLAFPTCASMTYLTDLNSLRILRARGLVESVSTKGGSVNSTRLALPCTKVSKTRGVTNLGRTRPQPLLCPSTLQFIVELSASKSRSSRLETEALEMEAHLSSRFKIGLLDTKTML